MHDHIDLDSPPGLPVRDLPEATLPPFDPQPIHGEALLGRMFGHQRQLCEEHRQSRDLDAGDAQLLPLMLSLGGVSACALVLGPVEVQVSGGAR